MSAYKKKGFSIGITLFLVMMFSPAPSGLSDVGWDVAAVAVLMAIWWATETVPVAITALLPLALFPLLGVTSFENAAVPYANKNIYLFLGGFMLALGMITRLIPLLAAASIFAVTPPIGSTSPRTERDPVMAKFWSIGMSSNAEIMAVAIVMLALSPSTPWVSTNWM